MATNIVGATGIDKVQDGIIVNADIDTVAASKLTGALPAISGASLTAIPAGNLTGTVADARISALTASKLTGTLPAISAANLTSIPAANITGTLPAISAANLTTIPAANITGTLPAISGANLTGISSQGRNLFINGGFDVWQRGTSASSSQQEYLADRWYNATSATQSRQTFTIGQTDVPHNPTYYHRQVTGSTEWYGLKQKIEDVSITAGREVTLSYWMKGSSAFTNAPFRNQNFGSGGSSEVNAALSTASITTSWARYTHTFTFPSISGKTVGDNNYVQIQLLRANVNNLTIEIANCQLEFGDTATDFEQRSYGEELTLCERYYQEFVCSHQEWIYVEGTNTTHKWWQVYYRNLRVAPTMTFSDEMIGASSGNVGGGNVVSCAATTRLNRASVRVTMSNTSGTVHGIHHIDAWSGDSCFLDAEL